MKILLLAISLMLANFLTFAQGSAESIDWSWMDYTLGEKVNLSSFVVKEKRGVLQTIVPIDDKRYSLEIDGAKSVSKITYHFADGTDMFKVQMKVMQELGDFHQETNEGDFLIETYQFRKDAFIGLQEFEITFISSSEKNVFLLVLSQNAFGFNQ